MTISLSSPISSLRYSTIAACSSPAFAIKKITSKAPLTTALKVEGLLWGTCWLWYLYDFCAHGRESLQLVRQGITDDRNRLKFKEEIKETCSHFINGAGSSASLALWAERAKWIILGKWTLLLQKITYVGFFLGSCLSLEKTVKTLQKERISILESQNAADHMKHRHYYRCAQLDLASHVSTIAWAILGGLELCLSVAFPWITTPVLLVSCALTCASMVYTCYITQKIEQKDLNSR